MRVSAELVSGSTQEVSRMEDIERVHRADNHGAVENVEVYFGLDDPAGPTVR